MKQLLVFTRRVSSFVFYPWLLTLYPIIYLYSVNLASIREDDVLEVVLVALAVVTVVYAVLVLLLRDPHKTGGVTGIMVLVFLTYGHIYNNLSGTSLGQTLLMPVMLVLAAVLIYFIVRSKTLWQQLAPYLNLIFAVLVLMPSWSVVDYFIDKPPAGATALANPLERVMSAETVNNSPERPDIYYIILDGYSSNSFLLREYGYDNSDFTDGLEGRGFFVAYDSQSNYGVTLVSLPSSLNMRYIDDEDRQAAGRYNLDSSTYLRSLIANNQVAYELKQLGYTYLYMLSGHIVPSVMADTNIAFYPEGSRYFAGADLGEEKSEGDWAYKQPFMSFFLKTTLLRSIAHRFDVQEEGEPYSMASPEMFWATLAELERVPAMEEATFTFAHFVKPHGPIIFDKYGNAIDVEFDDEDPEKARYFFDELQYLNTQILTLVDHILAQSSEPPIIILQADHGSNLGNPWDAGWRWTHFEIFNAYYFPDHATELLHPEIAPLNSFRAVFNQFFDGNYEMLESKQYTVPRGWWMGDYFTHVRYEDDRRLNVELGDQIVLIYEGVDDGGAPELDIHAVSEDGGKGELLFTIAHENISNFLETPPDQNTLITQQGQVALYALTTGEFQFNIGPDAEGREWAIIIDSLPARISYGYEVGVQ